MLERKNRYLAIIPARSGSKGIINGKTYTKRSTLELNELVEQAYSGGISDGLLQPSNNPTIHKKIDKPLVNWTILVRLNLH